MPYDVSMPQQGSTIEHASGADEKVAEQLNRILASKAYTHGFHDVTVGNNTVTAFDSQGNLVTIPGYNAGSGWDAVTGVGTPQVSNLIPLLVKYVRPGDGNGL